jgi:hypothetical protein
MKRFYISNENDARRCNEVRSLRLSSTVTGLTIEGEIGPASMPFPSCLPHCLILDHVSNFIQTHLRHAL